MINQIADEILNLWQTGRKTRRAPTGWVTGNAVCCAHHGESVDTRGRGGLIVDPAKGTANWHCFNCNFKTSYVPGRPLTYKFRKLLGWMGADPGFVERLGIEALRIKDLVPLVDVKSDAVISEPIVFAARDLPPGAVNFQGMAEFYQLSNRPIPADFIDVVDYTANRSIDFQKYDFYWTPEEIYALNRRVIVPFIWQNKIIGYTARSVDSNAKSKYHSDHPANFVFNVNKQPHNAKFVVVCEGPFDAMSIDGVAVLSNDISEQQADIIDDLGREVIVVPDFDIKSEEKSKHKKWSGARLIDRAMEYGWSVSFPIWHETCKDVNEAVVKYGKLFVLKAILAGKETSKLKIELQRKKLYNKL